MLKVCLLNAEDPARLCNRSSHADDAREGPSKGYFVSQRTLNVHVAGCEPFGQIPTRVFAEGSKGVLIGRGIDCYDKPTTSGHPAVGNDQFEFSGLPIHHFIHTVLVGGHDHPDANPTGHQLHPGRRPTADGAENHRNAPPVRQVSISRPLPAS